MLERSEAGWDRLTLTPSVALFPPEIEQLEATLDGLRRAGGAVTLGRPIRA